MTRPCTASSPPAPPALRARHDGWTPDRQGRFLAALAACRSVTGAARQAGISVRSAYRLRGHPAGATFRAAWDAALAPDLAPLDVTLLDLIETPVPRPCRHGGGDAMRMLPMPAGALIALLTRLEAKAAKAQNRAKTELL